MLGNVIKLLIISHCFGRLPRLIRTIPNLQATTNGVSVNVLHEQIKCELIHLRDIYLTDVLASCHRALRSSTFKHITKAMPLVCTFLGLALVLEKIEIKLWDEWVEKSDQRLRDSISSSFVDIEQGYSLLVDLCKMGCGAGSSSHILSRIPADSSPERVLITGLQSLVSDHCEFSPNCVLPLLILLRWSPSRPAHR